MTLFASQFSRHIELTDKTLIPVNAITFVLASSGFNKDRSANGMRKCFSEGYTLINEKRKNLAIQKAIQLATLDGKCNNPNDITCWKQFYEDPTPLFIATSTEEGLISHINELEEDELGAASIYVGELGSELQSNPNIINNIRLYSELYDLGFKEVKKIKSKEFQAKSINCIAANGLFIGSHDNILYDDTVKNKFKLEFTTKLARRSFFTFTPDIPEPLTFDSMDKLLAHDLSEESLAFNSRNKVNELAKDVATHNLGIVLRTPIKETPEVTQLFLAYKRYNEILANNLNPLYPITKLVRKHAQWRALKLAGAFAIMAKHNEIQPEDFGHAITYIELISNDMIRFEEEFRKEAYEQFIDYMNFISIDNKSSVSIHTLRKMGYIPTSGASDSRIKELVRLASSLNNEGIYTIADNGIDFERQIKTDVVGMSFKHVTGTKEERAPKIVDGYKYIDVTFEQIAGLLEQDAAYNGFEFKKGIRGKDNILGGSKVVILDVDNSKISDEDTHYILQDINHHIVRTSDKDNPFKFRVIIELDSVVDIKDILWKGFIESIAEYLSLSVDLLPKSQIYFCWSDRKVLSVIDKVPLETRDHILAAHDKSLVNKVDVKSFSTKKKKEMLENPMDTFFYLYDCPDGKGSVTMIRAAYHLRDIGATVEEASAVLSEANNYWVVPLPEKRFIGTVLNQLPVIWNK